MNNHENNRYLQIEVDGKPINVRATRKGQKISYWDLDTGKRINRLNISLSFQDKIKYLFIGDKEVLERLLP